MAAWSAWNGRRRFARDLSSEAAPQCPCCSAVARDTTRSRGTRGGRARACACERERAIRREKLTYAALQRCCYWLLCPATMRCRRRLLVAVQSLVRSNLTANEEGMNKLRFYQAL
eukprot:scaffold7039_cov255-Pinguiococcus_pyrenoidosus.AAC.12